MIGASSVELVADGGEVGEQVIGTLRGRLVDLREVEVCLGMDQKSSNARERSRQLGRVDGLVRHVAEAPVRAVVFTLLAAGSMHDQETEFRVAYAGPRMGFELSVLEALSR